MATGDFALKAPQMRQAATLYGRGYSRQQIADYFGVSKNAVRNALDHQSIKPRSKVHGRALRSKLPSIPTNQDPSHGK